MLLKPRLALALIVTFAAPAFAQDAMQPAGSMKPSGTMQSGDQMMAADHAMTPMSKADKATMAKCHKMSAATKKKNAKCTKLMAMHSGAKM